MVLRSSLFRGFGVFVAGGALAVWGYHGMVNDPALVRRVAELEQERGQLLRKIAFLKERQRVARIEVLEQFEDQSAQSGQRTRIRFLELDREGNPFGPGQEFAIDGDLLYVDAQVIKFDPDFAFDQGLESGSTLLLFRRLFGEFQAPVDGFVLDHVGIHPPAWSAEEGGNEFTAELWQGFWDYANRPEVLRRSGVHAMHGEAPSIKVENGRSYLLELRSSDGLSIRAEATPAPSGQ